MPRRLQRGQLGRYNVRRVGLVQGTERTLQKSSALLPCVCPVHGVVYLSEVEQWDLLVSAWSPYTELQHGWTGEACSGFIDVLSYGVSPSIVGEGYSRSILIRKTVSEADATEISSRRIRQFAGGDVIYNALKVVDLYEVDHRQRTIDT